jgi:type II secretory pathway component GspD/PulD (secretin)
MPGFRPFLLTLLGGILLSGASLRAQEAAPAEAVPAPQPAPVPAPERPVVTVSNETFAAAAEAPAPTIDLPPVDAAPAGIEIEQSDADADKISVTLDDVPLKDVIRMFSRISAANIVAMDDLEGRVTVSLNDVSWKDALEAILEQAGLVLVEKRPGIYSVIRREDLASEPLVTEYVVLNFVTISNVVPVVNSLLVSTNATVAPLPSANALVITETAMQITKIRGVISQLDKPRDQVYIEAKFVELNDSAIEDLGVNWQSLQNFTITAGNLSRDYTRTRRSLTTDSPGVFAVDATNTSRTRNSANETNTEANFSRDNLDGLVTQNDFNRGALTTSGASSSSIRNTQVANVLVQGRNFEDLSIDQEGTVTMQSVPANDITDVRTAILSASEFALTLSMLRQLDGASVVSNPKLLVSNGEQAMIHVGRNEPNIVAVPQGDQGNQYAYQLDSRQPFIEIGIKLRVRPTINTPESITIRVEPELSRLLGQKVVGEANTSFPITQVRKILTEFNVESGKTVAIGGLTETTDKDAVKKVPVLGDIPIIGKYLFSHRKDESIQDEVIIFVTVEMANPKQIQEYSGLPSKGRLIHKHLEAEGITRDATASASEVKAKPNEDVEKLLERIRREKAAAESAVETEPSTLPVPPAPAEGTAAGAVPAAPVPPTAP